MGFSSLKTLFFLVSVFLPMSNINRNLQKSVVDPVKVHIFRILAQKGKNSLNESAFPTCPQKNAIMST